MLIEKIGTPAMLEQTAEECAELAQACLKLSRKLRGENTTPKSEEACIKDLEEEIADALICIGELTGADNFLNLDNIDTWMDYKEKRIEERFKNVHTKCIKRKKEIWQ